MAWTPGRNSWRVVRDHRSDDAGKALHNIHAHNAFAAWPIPGDAIPLFRDPVIER